MSEDEGERQLTSVALPLRDGEEIVGVAGFTTDVSEPVEQERVVEHGHPTGYAGSGVGLTVVSRVAEGWTFELGESEEDGARFEFPADG